MPSAQADRLNRVRAASAALDRLVRELPGTWALMRDNLAGQPRAAAPDGRGDPVAWCWVHERTVAECDRADMACTGEVLTGPADPTGTAALQGDRTARDHRELDRRLDKLASLVAEAEAITAGYPGAAMEVEGERPGPGEHHCRLCWLDGKRIKEIDLNTKGRPYYSGLCRRCGRWRSKLGGDLPTWFVHMLNEKEPIRPWHEKRARDQIQAAQPKPGKKAKKAKSRRETSEWSGCTG